MFFSDFRYGFHTLGKIGKNISDRRSWRFSKILIFESKKSFFEFVRSNDFYSTKVFTRRYQSSYSTRLNTSVVNVRCGIESIHTRNFYHTRIWSSAILKILMSGMKIVRSIKSSHFWKFCDHYYHNVSIFDVWSVFFVTLKRFSIYLR